MPNRWKVRVAIIDTGVDLFHPTLRDCVSKYYSWIGAPTNADDTDGHGTYCAYFLSQVAPEAEVHVAKVFSGKDFSETEAQNIAKAIRHAVDDWKVDILSMSFGLPKPSPKTEHDIKEAIKHAAINNVLMFAAASNEGVGHPRTFPSTIRSVICIHASDGMGVNGDINPYHEQGDHNFMTLGIAIKSPKFRQPGDAYKSGTSFATPVAAGIAANLLEIAPNEKSRKTLRDPEDMRKMFALMSERVGKYAHVAPSLLRRQDDNHHFLEERGLGRCT
ncbi:subtilisin-like protein [Zopfia rhizophila CBS 207.26]|uniref:Subtilisin-like protein n=1 Tax=Zopfia rhizophila CBS 207.26 TaxID=1314779 RepID=A0A6A6D956_9PEZI|nr:subtilisin-like protein [Zopfia rhizophila CBS 207.26]